MRTRRRVASIVASAAALGVGLFAFTGSAAAEPVVPTCTPVASAGNDSCVSLKVTPGNAPTTFGNAQLGVRTRTTFDAPGDTANGGEAKTVTLLFDNDFQFNTGTVAGNCALADVANKTIAQAYAACGPAGKNAYLSPANTISGRGSSAPPSNFGVCTMVFKGPTANQVILYGRVAAVANSNPTCTTPAASTPGNVTVTLTGTIANAGVAGYGKKLTISNIDSLALPLDDFYATINRGAYFKAQCPAGASPWKLRGTFLYSGNGGGGSDTINKTQACT
jgi:hypothetical protein